MLFICCSSIDVLQLSFCICHFAIFVLHLLFCNCRFAIVVLQLSFCNCCVAIVALQLSFCNCRVAIVVLQSSFCNSCFAIIVLQLSFCHCCFANPKGLRDEKPKKSLQTKSQRSPYRRKAREARVLDLKHAVALGQAAANRWQQEQAQAACPQGWGQWWPSTSRAS